MIEIMQYLTTELKKLNPRVFNETANSDAIFPYVVFHLSSQMELDESNEEYITLEIDVWDINKDGYDATYNIEVLTKRIEDFFKGNRHIDENQLLIFSKLGRYNLRDVDENIKRRQIRYAIKYYNRNI